jgi:sigma-E factor negative regulatory protein RseA
LHPDALAALSAWADGQADAADAAMSAWARDPRARAAWHAWHVSGDVMRSDDLARDAASDEAFLQRLRQRLAEEPVVLAPTPAPSMAVQRLAPRTRAVSRPWAMAAAVAGVMAVGGMAWQMQAGDPASPTPMAAPSGGSPVLASTPPLMAVPSAAGDVQRTSGGAEPEPQWRMLDGQVVRDARLAGYLRAHRGAGAAAGRVETVVLER